MADGEFISKLENTQSTLFKYSGSLSNTIPANHFKNQSYRIDIVEDFEAENIELA